MSNLRITNRIGLSLVLIAVASWCSWTISPRYQLPADIEGSPCSALLNSYLTEITRDQSYIRTDASLEDLRQHIRLGPAFKNLNGSPFETLGFYWVRLRLSSRFFVGGPSSPFRDLVNIVNCQENAQVWKITNENFVEEFVGLLRDFNFVVDDEHDARIVCTLWHLLVPHPVPDFDVEAVRDGWKCSHQQQGAAVEILFSMDSVGLVSAVEQR
ncbi:MAG: hypothetical protein WAO83_13580 [Fuerstiella sp.]